MQTTWYHFTSTSNLLNIVKASKIVLLPFQSGKVKNQYPHVLLSPHSEFDLTTEAILSDVYGNDSKTGEQYFKLEVGPLLKVIPWKHFKQMHHIKEKTPSDTYYGDYIENEEEALYVAVEEIPSSKWQSVEQWDAENQTWAKVTLNEFLNVHSNEVEQNNKRIKEDAHQYRLLQAENLLNALENYKKGNSEPFNQLLDKEGKIKVN